MKQKWKHNLPEPLVHSNGHVTREVYSYECLNSKIREFPKNGMIHLKLLENTRRSKSKNNRWKEIIKIREKIYETKSRCLWKDEQD
jgi:hypothetical protein